MPGIYAYLPRYQDSNLGETLHAMADSMLYERAYSANTYIDQQLFIGCGIVSGHQASRERAPFWTKNRSACLFLTGEIFLQESPRECPNHEFILLEQYVNKGTNVLKDVNGAFAGLIVDYSRRHVVVFGDRYGLERLYVHEGPDGYYIASEAKAILACVPETRSLRGDSLGEWFTCGAVMGGKTLFKDVDTVPPGSVLSFGDDRILKSSLYFDQTEWCELDRLSPGDYYSLLVKRFRECLPAYCRDSGRAAISLTGGLDSRMIMACADLLPEGMKSYTFGGMYRECADVRIAKMLAEKCHLSHQVLAVGEEFLASFPESLRLCTLASDGMMDGLGAAGIYTNKLAKEIAPVRLTGNYGSELLRGNIAFRAHGVPDWGFRDCFQPLLSAGLETYMKESSGSRNAFVTFKQMPWYHHLRYSLERSQILVRSPFIDNDIVRLSFQAPANNEQNRKIAYRFIEENGEDLGMIPTDRGSLRRPRALSTKAWRWCQEFLPRAEYVFDYGMPQWLSRIDGRLKWLRIERPWIGRQKYCHFRIWYRDQLSEFVREILLDSGSASREIINSETLERLVLLHTKGTGNYTSMIHRLLAYESLHAHLVRQDGTF